jgi:hypothetical protein
MSQLTLNLPDKLASELAEASRQTNRSPDDLAVDLLRRALAVRRFKAARESVQNALGEGAPPSDDDAFKLLS